MMAVIDKLKTSFTTEWGIYCYTVMPFGLKNVGATYQRMATTLLHDMIHKKIEVYIDDMIMKFVTREGHFEALDKFLARAKKYNLRLNPKKCVFRLTSGKLLGHIVSQKRIEVDPDKVKAIREMFSPRTKKQVKGFIGQLQYISRFIAKLMTICKPIFKFLRKDQPVIWDDKCQ